MSLKSVVFVYSLSYVYLFCLPRDCSPLAPLSIGFPRQESWTGLPFSPSGNLPDAETEPTYPTLAGVFFFFHFTILYWLCHTLTWICHECTCVPHPEAPSHLPPHPIPLGHPSVPARSTLYHALNLDWRFVSHAIIYMFQCHSPISSHPRPFPQSPKDYSIHLCLFCCLAYRVIVTIFLNSIYMH